MLKEQMKDTEGKMKRALDALKRDLGTVRTGRANPALLEGLKVDYYGTATPINQLASVTVPESRLLVIQPWDPTTLKEIERAVLASDLGLTPVNDGKIIRIGIPPLTEDRRKELIKMVKKMAEDYRVEIRNFRREGKDSLEEMEKEKIIGEDDLRRGLKELQDLTDHVIKDVDKILEAKEAEILEV